MRIRGLASKLAHRAAPTRMVVVAIRFILRKVNSMLDDADRREKAAPARSRLVESPKKTIWVLPRAVIGSKSLYPKNLNQDHAIAQILSMRTLHCARAAMAMAVTNSARGRCLRRDSGLVDIEFAVASYFPSSRSPELPPTTGIFRNLIGSSGGANDSLQFPPFLPILCRHAANGAARAV